MLLYIFSSRFPLPARPNKFIHAPSLSFSCKLNSLILPCLLHFQLAIKMPKSINVVFLLNLLNYFKVIFMVALAHLGLFHPPEQAYSEEHPASTYVIVMDRQTPSLVPVAVVMEWIKKRVPVVEYGSLLERQGRKEDKDAGCSVCLDCIKRSHEIRELSNCCHVFHKECLDSWVDKGQVTCPLCRSMLFPGSI